MNHILVMDSAGHALNFMKKGNDVWRTYDTFSFKYLYKSWAVDDENTYVPSIYAIEDYIKGAKIELNLEKHSKLKSSIIRYKEIIDEGIDFEMPKNTGEPGVTHRGMDTRLFTSQEDFNYSLEKINKNYALLMEFRAVAKAIEEEAVKISELREYYSNWYSNRSNYYKIEDLCAGLYGANAEVEEKLIKWYKAFQKKGSNYDNINVMDYSNDLVPSLNNLLEVKEWSGNKNVYVIGQYIEATQSFGFLTTAKKTKDNDEKMYVSTLEAANVLAVFYNKDLAYKMLFNESSASDFDIDGEQCLLHYKAGKLSKIHHWEEMGRSAQLYNRIDEFNLLIEKLLITKEMEKEGNMANSINNPRNINKTNVIKKEKIKI